MEMKELEKVIRGLRDIDMFIAGRLEHEKAKNFLRTIDKTIVLLKEQEETINDLTDTIRQLNQHIKDLSEYMTPYGKVKDVKAYAELLKEQEEQIKNRDESLEKAREEIKWLRGMLKEQYWEGDEMAELEKVIKEWESVLSRDPLDAPWDLIDDTLALLKEQEDLGEELTNAVELIHKKNERIEQLNRFVNGFSRDAIPVVRCKDCKHGEKANDVYLCGKPRGFGLAHEPNWFCADGERR